jgi:hypothetical protein
MKEETDIDVAKLLNNGIMKISKKKIQKKDFDDERQILYNQTIYISFID